METFSDFKKKFYSRITDFSIFNCQDFNLLKVVLDGLRVNYSERGKFRTPLFYPDIIFFPFTIIKYLFLLTKTPFKKSIPSRYNKRPFLFIDASARVVSDEKNNAHSLYFDFFLNNFPDDKKVYIVETVKSKKLKYDILRTDFDALFANSILDKSEIRLRISLKRTYKKILNAGVFNEKELKNIRCGIQNFFDNFRIWEKIINAIEPQVAIFDMHYHREGCILALKKKNIKTIELQHGLIAPEDIFYMFPDNTKSVCDKSLFADEIWVYGNFWKERLLKGAEYSHDKIKIIGFFLYNNPTIPKETEEEFKEVIKHKKIVLITTQPALKSSYIKYIQNLSEIIRAKYSDWFMVVKPHPEEKMDNYLQMEKSGCVKVTNINLDYLLKISQIHISIYSTTLFDALRYNVKNYTLYDEECKDYVQTMINDKIAEVLYFSEDPIEKMHKNSHTNVKNEDYFSEINMPLIEELKSVC